MTSLSTNPSNKAIAGELSLPESSWIYRLGLAIAIEDFGERSLTLHCTGLRFVELNKTARDILSRLDGQASLYQVALTLAKDYDQPLDAVLADVQNILAQMDALEIVERIGLNAQE